MKAAVSIHAGDDTPKILPLNDNQGVLLRHRPRKITICRIVAADEDIINILGDSKTFHFPKLGSQAPRSRYVGATLPQPRLVPDDQQKHP